MPKQGKKLPQTLKGAAADQKRTYVSQTHIPKRSLREALTVAQCITDNFGGHPTSPHQVAMGLNLSPTSSGWRDLTGAAVAYGLTKGAYNSDKIALESLGRRATAPTEEGDEVKARAESVLKPAIFEKFFGKYNKAKFPPDQIAKNVLAHEFSVPTDRTAEVLEMLKDNGAFVGFIHDTKTGPFVALDDLKPQPVTPEATSNPGESESASVEGSDGKKSEAPKHTEQSKDSPKKQINEEDDAGPFKVFISHGKNMELVDQVKDVLDLYDIEYEIAVEEETTAIPVPQKIVTAMRRCRAGVMVVSADEQGRHEEGFSINNNVLIEIGAAFVLYDQKVVLLWDKRLKVPSNLQGLYRCEFEGNQLTFSVGTKLAKALKGFRGK